MEGATGVYNQVLLQQLGCCLIRKSCIYKTLVPQQNFVKRKGLGLREGTSKTRYAVGSCVLKAQSLMCWLLNYVEEWNYTAREF